MPLVRYDLGDLVERGPDGPCPCGRALPTIGRVFGRSVDAITTPDGRVITAAAIVFNVVPNILRGQLVQEDRARLHARVLPSDSYTDTDERRLAAEITRLVGPSMTVTIERVAGPDAFGGPGEKHRAVVSPLTRAAVARGQPIA
jgi:phenylacetate-CoA ligase